MKFKLKILITLIQLSCIFPAIGQEKLLLTGSCNTSIMIVNKENGSIEWQHTVEPYEMGVECNSVDMTENGDILYAYKKGVKLITARHETVWDYKAPKGTEIHSASILSDGGFLIAINGVPTRIIELDKTGKVRDSINIKENLGNENIHMQCRQIRKTINGNYLVPILGKTKLYEIDSQGNTVNSYSIKGGAFSVTETLSDTLLVPLGDAHSLQVINKKTGKEIAFIGSDGLKGCTIQFAGEITKLRNGHFILANWSGHSTETNSAQVIEFDLTGNVYWTLKGKEYGPISTCHPIYKNISR